MRSDDEFDRIVDEMLERPSTWLQYGPSPAGRIFEDNISEGIPPFYLKELNELSLPERIGFDPACCCDGPDDVPRPRRFLLGTELVVGEVSVLGARGAPANRLT
jgi:hypothetical protein